MANNFSEEVRALNVHHNFCRKCGCNEMCSLHHIYTRSRHYSSSALNSIWLCYDCHKKADGYNQGGKDNEKIKELLKLQLEFLISQGYKYKDIDYKFLKSIDMDLMEILKG